MKLKKSHNIPEHWDTGREILGDASPNEEFSLWQKYAEENPDWEGNEFVVADFDRYIRGLSE